MITTLNIRSDLMATWECEKQVQASPQLLAKHNTYALGCRELKENLHRSIQRGTSVVAESLAQMHVIQMVKFLKFQVGIISLDSQDPQILEICKKLCQRPSLWTIYQELCHLIIRAVQSLLCWILKCGDH